MKKSVLFVFVILLTSQTYAQKNKIKQTTLWFRYRIDLSLPKNIKLYAEAEERIFVAPTVKNLQSLLRFGTEKTFKNNWYIGGGFVTFLNGTNDATNPSKLVAPEPRPFFDAGYKQKINDKFFINHRYRVEWRFFKNTNKTYTELEDGFNNNFRFRYQVGLNIVPFKKEDKEFRITISDEIMINAGKNIQKNIFDQNRVTLALRYNFNKNIGTEFSYLYWLQQRANGTDFYSRQILRFTLYNNFEINKKDKN